MDGEDFRSEQRNYCKRGSLIRGTERTLAILEFLGGFRKGKSISEIARGLNLPINSVSRITDTMTLRGWLYRKEDDRRFVLTNRVAE